MGAVPLLHYLNGVAGGGGHTHLFRMPVLSITGTREDGVLFPQRTDHRWRIVHSTLPIVVHSCLSYSNYSIGIPSRLFSPLPVPRYSCRLLVAIYIPCLTYLSVPSPSISPIPAMYI